MQAKQRALEHNRLDVRFEDYLIQLFSCQSDKGEALNQVTTRRENILCLFVERWPLCLQHMVESVHQHHNCFSSKTQKSFTIQPVHAPFAVAYPHPILPSTLSLPKEDTTWLYYCRQAS